MSLSTLCGAFDFDLALLLDVPFRRRRFSGEVAGAAGVAASPAAAVLFSSVTVQPGTGVPASSKGNLSKLRLLDFYRGGTLIASPCGADIIGLS